jgi:hypothetical protein
MPRQGAPLNCQYKSEAMQQHARDRIEDSKASPSSGSALLEEPLSLLLLLPLLLLLSLLLLESSL